MQDSPQNATLSPTEIRPLAEKLNQAIKTCMMGKDDVIDTLLAAVLAGGHVLLEDLPGTGKTTMAKALAKAIDGQFRRIQFTPDLLPSELTGINFFNQQSQDFMFREGALFTNILLADEINRATPRTQSSLLECMEERQVTVDGKTYPLAAPFLVLATQNPVEIHGTFPLPEAQMDRFMVRLSVGYPDAQYERDILSNYRADTPLDRLEAVMHTDDLNQMIAGVRQITVSDSVKDYIVQVTGATRTHEKIRLGVSPRGSLALMRMGQAFAAMDGLDYVRPDHVQRAIRPTLTHRILLRGTSVDKQQDKVEEVLESIITNIQVPTEIADAESQQ